MLGQAHRACATPRDASFTQRIAHANDRESRSKSRLEAIRAQRTAPRFTTRAPPPASPSTRVSGGAGALSARASGAYAARRPGAIEKKAQVDLFWKDLGNPG